MTNLDSILKSRNITLPIKVCLVKATVFPVVMYGYESWTIKKAECRRIAAFELWCWRRLLRVLWAARRSNQSILKEIIKIFSDQVPLFTFCGFQGKYSNFRIKQTAGGWQCLFYKCLEVVWKRCL